MVTITEENHSVEDNNSDQYKTNKSNSIKQTKRNNKNAKKQKASSGEADSEKQPELNASNFPDMYPLIDAKLDRLDLCATEGGIETTERQKDVMREALCLLSKEELDAWEDKLEVHYITQIERPKTWVQQGMKQTRFVEKAFRATNIASFISR